jgi:hypothetical protein
MVHGKEDRKGWLYTETLFLLDVRQSSQAFGQLEGGQDASRNETAPSQH